MPRIAARETLRRYGPGRPQEIATACGIPVIRRKLSPGVLGALGYDDEHGTWAILVNEEANLAEEEFTVAHELGHYVMHQKKPGIKVVT